MPEVKMWGFPLLPILEPNLYPNTSTRYTLNPTGNQGGGGGNYGGGGGGGQGGQYGGGGGKPRPPRPDPDVLCPTPQL